MFLKIWQTFSGRAFLDRCENTYVIFVIALHYNHCVSLYFRPYVRSSAVSENAHNSCAYQIVNAYACQHCLTTGMHNNPC